MKEQLLKLLADCKTKTEIDVRIEEVISLIANTLVEIQPALSADEAHQTATGIAMALLEEATK